MTNHFIGRKKELQQLSALRNKRSASLVVLHGRRRIGKSRLIEEFGRNQIFFSFAGLYPEKGSTAENQLAEFHQQLLSQTQMQLKPFQDWSEAFHHLAEQTKKGKTLILLDEISWMGAHDVNFLGKLKNAWDMKFSKNANLILVLCGSVSSWIEKNLLANQGFYGRISLKIRLSEIPLFDCNKFWHSSGAYISNYEKLKILAITGGIPKYLEEIQPNESADKNIRELCFTESGLLFNDYNYIFSSMLERESQLYQEITEKLCQQKLSREELLASLHKKSGGMITSYISELESAGFISRDFTWNLKTGMPAKSSQYRLSDNYIRFYIKYILPAISKIKAGQFELHSLSALPGWASIVGVQIENLILNNRKAIQQLMGIYPDEVVCDGPFFQRKTARMRGCQIDYLVQTKLGILYLCEIKFTRNVIHTDIIDEVKKKILHLSAPKNVSIIPVLIHAGEVHDNVTDAQFFGKTIDISQLLDET